MGLFSSDTNKYIGLDIGTSSIKLVELEKKKNEIKLATYGYSEFLQRKNRNDWRKDIKKTASIIMELYERAGVTSENVVASLPTFSVFSSIVNITGTGSKNLESAINREAKKVIPMPLEEMILDWTVLEKDKKNNNIKVFLTASPKKLVKSYIDIFRELNITLTSLETENFSLIRSLMGSDQTTAMIVGIGKTNSDISIVKDGIPVLNRSIDVGGISITKAIGKSLNIDQKRAEQFKCDMGISSFDSKKQDIPKVIVKSIDPIMNEIKYMLNLYEPKDGQKVEKIILTGGSAMLINLPNHFSKVLDMNVIIGDPWARIIYSKDIKSVLDEIGSRLAPVIGAAMRQFK